MDGMVMVGTVVTPLERVERDHLEEVESPERDLTMVDGDQMTAPAGDLTILTLLARVERDPRAPPRVQRDLLPRVQKDLLPRAAKDQASHRKDLRTPHRAGMDMEAGLTAGAVTTRVRVERDHQARVERDLLEEAGEVDHQARAERDLLEEVETQVTGDGMVTATVNTEASKHLYWRVPQE
jgi:hypothetical protein